MGVSGSRSVDRYPPFAIFEVIFMEKTTKQRTMTLLVAVLLLVALCALLFAPLGTSTAHAATSGDYQRVTVRYLERIGDSPFAKEVESEIYIPVYADHQIDVKDVCAALGYKAFGVMQSYCDTFNYNAEDNVYEAYYYKSVYFKPITVDGNSPKENMYLDINNSFEDYFKPFVRTNNDDTTKPFDESTYEYFWNSIHYDFPETANIKADELHGYWGMVALPETYSFSELWKELFNIDRTFQGVLRQIKVDQNLDWTSYNNLLKDYGYWWLERAWNTIVGFVAGMRYEADFYMLYVDSGITEAFLAENGATDINDDDGAFYNSVEGVVDWAGSLFNDFSKVGKIAALVIGVILLLLVLIVIIFLIKVFVFTPVKFLANTAKDITGDVTGTNRATYKRNTKGRKRK